MAFDTDAFKRIYERYCGEVKFRTDGREVTAGDVFVLLPFFVDKADHYVLQAIDNGCACLLIEEHIAVDVDLSAIDVCVLPAGALIPFLQALASQYRSSFQNKTLIGVTGSVGKSSVCAILAKLLSEVGRVCVSRSHENGQWGVAVTLLNVEQRCDFVVIEAGINGPFQMDKLAEMIKPDYGLLTQISTQHLEGLINTKNIVREKSRLFYNFGHLKYVVIPDHVVHKSMIESIVGAESLVYFQSSSKKDRQIDALSVEVRLKSLSTEQHFVYRLHNDMRQDQRENQLAALSLLYTIFSTLEPFFKSLESSDLPIIPKRMEHCYHPLGHLIIDDTWNASEKSVIHLIKYMMSKRFSAFRKVFVFAGMSELGVMLFAVYRRISLLVNDFQSLECVCIGPGAEIFFDFLNIEQKQYFINTHAFLHSSYHQTLFSSDRPTLIALKSSRGLGLDGLKDRLFLHLALMMGEV